MKVKYNCEISPTRCNNCNCCILLDLFHNYKAWCTEPQILNSSTSNRRNLLTSTRAPRESCIRRMRIKRNCCILLDLFHNYKAWCTEPQLLNWRWSVPVTGPVVAQRVGRCRALLFQDRGTRRGWVFSSRLRPYFTPGKDPVPIVQEAEWAPGPVWTGGKSRHTGIRSSDRPARIQSLYQLSYLAH